MKKLIFLSAVGSLLLAACSNEPSYKITGTTPDYVADGSIAYLRNSMAEALDSAVIKNHTFTFTGRQDSVVERWVVYKEPGHNLQAYMFLENGNIKVTLDDALSAAEGTQLNDTYKVFLTENANLNGKMREIYEKSQKKDITPEENKELATQFSELRKQSTDLVRKTLDANITNQVGICLLPDCANMFSLEDQKKWIDQIPEAKRTAPIKTMLSVIESVEKTAVGQKYLDFAMKDQEGKDVKLSDFVSKNKLTLIDFWASWCGPCRGEMPNIVKVYKKYHKKGFDIVGVSLDSSEKQWKDATKKMHMDWHHMSDLKGWACAGSRMYGVRGIPATVLVNQEGIIVARDLYGEELDAKIKELLK